jgi:hypothetical protein
MIDPRKPLDGLTLGDITGTCKSGITLSHAIHVNLYGIRVMGPTLLVNASDVTGSGLDNPTTPATEPTTRP